MHPPTPPSSRDEGRPQDYTSVRETITTGRLLDGSGDAAAAEIRDLRPHAFAPAAGLSLAGPHAFGRYTTDDQVISAT